MLTPEEQLKLVATIKSAIRKDPDCVTIIINSMQAGMMEKIDKYSRLAENYRIGMLSAMSLADPKRLSNSLKEHLNKVLLVKGMLGCEYDQEENVLNGECKMVIDYLCKIVDEYRGVQKESVAD